MTDCQCRCEAGSSENRETESGGPAKVLPHKPPRPGVNDPPDQRSPMAEALDWVSRITSISILMVLPGVLGYLADAKLNTKVLFTLLGFGLGMFAGIWQLIKETGRHSKTQTGADVKKNSERLFGQDDREQQESGGGEG